MAAAVVAGAMASLFSVHAPVGELAWARALALAFVVGAVLVEPTDEIMLISTGGVLIRTKVADIREMGRSTQGVTLINLDGGTRLAGVEKVIESDSEADVDSDAESAGEADAGDEGAE